MDIKILYEDTHLLVINKPYGVIVNRAQSVKGETLQDWVEQRIKSQIPASPAGRSNLNVQQKLDPSHWSLSFGHCDFCSRSGIVHRIDKETSGCLIIAKNPDAFFKLQALFKERQVKKEYIALVHGKIESRTGEINAPIGRLPWNKEHFGVFPGGKEAYTRYEVEQYYQATVIASKAKQSQNTEIYSLVRLFPTTGRTHQLRVHLKYLGFPIVGDYLYAGRKQQRADRLWCPRVFLHAEKISFPHPVTDQIIQIKAQLPLELEQVLSILQY